MDFYLHSPYMPSEGGEKQFVAERFLYICLFGLLASVTDGS